jgi:hypothetical protein
MGMPALVSNTAAYANTMRSIGLEQLVVKSPKQAAKMVRWLQPRKARAVIQNQYKMLPVDDFSPKKSGEALAEVFKSVYKA